MTATTGCVDAPHMHVDLCYQAGRAEGRAGLAADLRRLADDQELLWTVARRAIEDELVEWRDSGMFVIRGNGFAIRHKDGTDSSIIRFGPEVGVRIALRALADHVEGGDR